MKKIEFHQSSIGMFLKCPKQYMFRYVLGYILPPKGALTLGSSVDAGVTHNLRQKIETEQDLPVDTVLDVYSTEFDQRAPETDWEDSDPGKEKDQGAGLIKLHHEKCAPQIKPQTVQESFRIEFENKDYALAGTMDITTKDGLVRDTKTSKAKYAEDFVSTSIQAVAYDFGYEATRGKKPEAIAFDVLTKTKTPNYQEVKGVVSSVQREDFFQALNIAYSQIQRGEFLPAPEGAWWCSKSWCGYWDKCKGRK